MSMQLFDVYPLLNIEPQRGEGPYIYDKDGTEYLDFYGGHAVISIGHSHPTYVEKIQQQSAKLGFYSNSVQNPLQKELALKLGELSGYSDYTLFLCNSGAEANENALKLASFHTNKKKIISFTKGFHGRTSAAVAVTDNPNIIAPINELTELAVLNFNDIETFKQELDKGDVCAVIIEPIQGVGGINMPTDDFLKEISSLCHKNNVVLILDEVQSGYGRSGKFFAHQYAGIRPDLITVAKGMGNGFPIGGVLVSPKFESKHGLLGTTFGGNHLACAAGIAVLDVIKDEKLMENAAKLQRILFAEFEKIPEIKVIKGRGLMIGLDFGKPIRPLRKIMIEEEKVLTGVASNPHVLRLLPPLNINEQHINDFIDKLRNALKKLQVSEMV